MKLNLNLLFIFLFSFTFEKNITITNLKNFKCDPLFANNRFDIEAEIENDELDENDYIFFFNISGNITYRVQCTIPGKAPNNENSTGSNEVDLLTDSFIDTDFNFDENSYSDPTNLILRFLDINEKISGTCLTIEKIEKDETITSKNLSTNDNEINFNKNIKFNLTTCKKEEKIISKLIISFRQLNNFAFNETNKVIKFLFLGMISYNLTKGHQIMMNVNLIKNGIEDKNNPKTAICVLKDNIIFTNIPVQGDFSCTILNVSDTNVSSFVFNSSKYIVGIPQDKILLNPKSTEKYISLGKLKDYSKQNNEDFIPIPSFNSTKINDSFCSNYGKFTIFGKLTSNLSNDIVFELPFAYPENISAKCSIKSHKENEEGEIECETNQKFENDTIMIA